MPVPHLLQVSDDILSQSSFLVGDLGGAGLRLLRSCLSLHQPVALPLQEEFGFLDGCAVGGDVAFEPASTRSYDGETETTHSCC